jgi:hypothetical protein
MAQALLNTKPDVWPAEPIDASKPFKWQTRQVITLDVEEHFRYWKGDSGLLQKKKYAIGDILYVREPWRCSGVGKGGYRECAIIDYKAGGSKIIDIPSEKSVYYAGKALWRPPALMPCEAARLYLEVKNVRLERLQGISEEEAEAEGVNKCSMSATADDCAICRCSKNTCKTYYTRCFMSLWDSLSAKRGYGWEVNPYVFVYEFMRRGSDERD